MILGLVDEAPCVVVVPFGTRRSGSRGRRGMLCLAEPCFVPVAHFHRAASWAGRVKGAKRRACARTLDAVGPHSRCWTGDGDLAPARRRSKRNRIPSGGGEGKAVEVL